MFGFVRKWMSFLFPPGDLRAETRSDEDDFTELPDYNPIAQPPDEPILRLSPTVPPQPTQERWWEPREGMTPVLVAPAAPDASIHLKLFNQLTRALDDPALKLPQAPAVVQRALNMLRQPDVAYKTLADTVYQDAALTADVLRIANSVAYRGFSEVRRLDQAFSRLGQRELRRILLAIAVRTTSGGIPAEYRELGRELWRCALASAILMEHLAPRYGIAPNDAFLAGLLHDIGSLGLLRIVADFAETRGQTIPRPVFDRLVDKFHERLGLRIADVWELPPPLPELAGNHHHDLPDDEPLGELRSLVQFSDAACAALEYRHYVPYDLLRMKCAKRLKLTDTPETHELLRGLPVVLSERMVEME